MHFLDEETNIEANRVDLPTGDIYLVSEEGGTPPRTADSKASIPVLRGTSLTSNIF